MLGLRLEVGPEIVGAASQQQIKAGTLCLGEGVGPRRRSIRGGPSAISEIVTVFARSAGLDHAIQRNVFEDSDSSHIGVLQKEKPCLSTEKRGFFDQIDCRPDWNRETAV
jgi:hypothetical protein